MPNPLCDNDAAAQYLDFYGSATMEKQIVNRLYNQGVRQHNLARQRAEAASMPIRKPITRTPSQIKAYVRRAVEGEQALRQRHMIELTHQRRLEINPREATAKRSFSSKAEEKKHLSHMYDHQKRRFGFEHRDEALYREPDAVKTLERQWKATGAHVPRSDNKQLLAHGSPSCPTERPNLKAKSTLVGEDREHYYAQLAEPFRKWEKVQTESNANAFSSYTKYKRVVKPE